MRILSVLILMVFVLVSACTETTSSSPDATPDTVTTPDAAQDSVTASTTYHGHARTVLERRCVNCHTEGGGAPFTMDWVPEEWESGPAWWTSMALSAVDAGRMPPWQPVSDCVSIEDSRALSEEELATLQAWKTEGFALGEASDYEPPEPEGDEVALPEPTIKATANEPYTPDDTHPDDYRCFMLDATFETDRFTTRTDVWPGSLDVVHHVILYQVPSSNVALAESFDEEAEGLGYPCYGGPGVESNLIGGWVPGATAFEFPAGSALKIPAGSRIVMQMHYNTSYLDPEKEVPSDLTEMAIWLLPQGETPQDLAFFQSFSNHDIFIPANEAVSAHVRDQYMGWNGYIVGLVPHMHQLGTEIRGSLVNEHDGASCLFDIPKWDFNWQQLYTFEDGSEQPVHGLTRHRLTCIYDNSPENQPVVNGEQNNPKNVNWGDGTFDEMCINFLLIKFPFAATQHSCGNFNWCNEMCEEDVACMLGCAVGSSSECTTCVSDGYIGCGNENCPAETAAALACTGPCTDGGTALEDCVMSDCRADWQTAHECIHPLMKDGTCSSHFETCDFGE